MDDLVISWLLAPGVCKERIGDDMVLLDTQAGQYFELNDSAARMVELLDQLGSTEAVMEALCEEYEADPDQLAEELQKLIDQLATRQLLIVRQT